jgi:hypothetical protein
MRSPGDGDDDEPLGTGKAAATPEHDVHTQGSVYGDALSDDEYVLDYARPPPFHYIMVAAIVVLKGSMGTAMA